MKCMKLAAGLLLATSLQAGAQSQPEKKEITHEHKVLTGLRATGAALGAGVSLYHAYQYYVFAGTADGREKLAAWVAVGLFLYPGYTLGRKALALTGVIQAEDTSTAEKTEVEKEHKVVSGLKATGAVAGAWLSVLFTDAYYQNLFTHGGFETGSLRMAILMGSAAYTACLLGHHAVCSVKRLLDK